MRQEERNRIKREKIMAAALREFGSKNYAEASINAICAEDGISKGIVYHYYEDKDALYLACLDESLTAMVNYLKEHMPVLEGSVEEKLDGYFAVRLRFLEEHPHYQGIFYQATMYAPLHLRERIAQVRRPFDSYNMAVLQDIMGDLKLRRHIGQEDLAALYTLYVVYVNNTAQMQSAMAAGNPAEREELCKQWVLTLLYGVVER